MQRNYTTLQPAQAGSAEQILRGTLPAVRSKKARSEHASPPSSWDKADRLIVEFPIDMAPSGVTFHSPNSTTIKEIPWQTSITSNQLLYVGSQKLHPQATVSSVEKCHQRFFVTEGSIKHLTTRSPEKYEATLSYCGASISNTHFLPSLLA